LANIKQEPGTSPLILAGGLSPGNASQTPGTLIAGNATLLADDNQLFQKMTGISGINFLEAGYMGTPVSSSGSLVWRSPEDLFRCNICDMKFSQLSTLQV